MKIVVSLGAAALLLASASAMAQVAEAGLPPAATDPAATNPGTDIPMPATDQPPAIAPARFTDEQVDTFAAVNTRIKALQGDDAAKQAQAEAIVAEAGLDTATFNAMMRAAQSDPAFAERVQLAMEKHAPNPSS